MAATTVKVPNRVGAAKFTPTGNVNGGIVAKAGGGQTSATQLVAQLNVVATVASDHDSVKLPKIVPSPNTLGSINAMVVVSNASANSLQVFGGSPDTVDGVVTGTGVPVPAGMTAIFFAASYTQSTNVGTWRSTAAAGVGATGATGPTGPTGATGPTGPTGGP